ncbi:MAG TPA: hypothetical protein ENK62_09925 [Chromatiales bacterium]|nr:hypothetical protein [Chromatiales bacterium]
MHETPYAYILVVIELLFTSMLLAALRRAGARRRTLVLSGGVLVLWLTAAYGLLATGSLAATGMPRTAFTLAVALPTVGGLLAVFLWRPLRSAVSAMPTRSFLRLQRMRAVFGSLFFFTAALPAWFQYVGGLGDVAAGTAALLALAYLRAHPDRERRAVLVGNLPGVLDFVVVMTLGVFVVLRDHAPDFAFNLIPLYVVPLFILLHVFSLRRLGHLHELAAPQSGTRTAHPLATEVPPHV